MSNGRRHRRRIGRQAHQPEWVCVQVAGTRTADPEEIQDAQRATHDALIGQLGDARRSGVRWILYEPHERDAAIARLDAAHDDGKRYTGLREWFEEHPEGCLVVAMAEAVRS